MTTPQDLHAALRDGDDDRVETLLAACPSLAGSAGPDGLSPLMTALYRRRPRAAAALLQVRPPATICEAAATGDTERVASFLADDCDAVDTRHLDGFTPLHLAAFFGHAETVRLLLGAGADADSVADNPSRVRPLHSAAAGHCLPAVTALLAAGSTADARQAGGWTALMAAAKDGQTDMVRALLAAGAAPSLRSVDGRSAPDLAREAGHVETLAALQGEK